MEAYDHITLARDIIQTLPKAKKMVRMYPENNPVYMKTVDDLFARFSDFFNYRNELALKIKQYDIFFDSEQIYHNPDKEDNLALSFFKDGLRELSFHKGLSIQEVRDFLDVIARDFERVDMDDDMVTLLWEKDFQNIKYVADETVITGDTDYDSTATAEIKEKAATEVDLMRAYSDSFTAENLGEIQISSITDKDLQMLIKAIESDIDDKSEKLSAILFEMLLLSENKDEHDDIIRLFKAATVYSVRNGILMPLVNTMKRITTAGDNPLATEAMKEKIGLVLSYINSEESIKYIGEMLDSGKEVDENTLDSYINFLNKDSIIPFMALLGELKTIHGRKTVITILTKLGGMDIQAVGRGISDPRWYVVRNVIYILHRIGDKKAVEYLLNGTKHHDARVRKEAIKAIGDLRSPEALQGLKHCLNDEDSSVRRSAVKVIGDYDSETAKRMIFEKVLEKNFSEREFDEKKEFFGALSRWNDKDIADFMIRTLTKKSLFKMAKNNENRACAAYCLGLMGNRDALPALARFKQSNSRLLQKCANEAITRIEHGR